MISPETRRAVLRKRALERLEISNAAPLVDHPAMTRLQRADDHHQIMFMAVLEFKGHEEAPAGQMARFYAAFARAHRKHDELCAWCKEGIGQ